MPTAIERQREVIRAKNYRDQTGQMNVQKWEEREFATLTSAMDFINDRLNLGLACSRKSALGVYMVTVWGPLV